MTKIQIDARLLEILLDATGVIFRDGDEFVIQTRSNYGRGRTLQLPVFSFEFNAVWRVKKVKS